MANVGYCRVSSTGQSLQVQRDKLAFCDEIFEEKKSGSNRNRPALEDALHYCRKGDKLYCSRIDRLARSTLHLFQISEELKAKGVDLIFIDQKVDSSTSSGKLLFGMLALISEFELEIRKERQRDGIDKALAKGTQFGFKCRLTQKQVDEMRAKRAAGARVCDLVKEYEMSRPSIYRLLEKDPHNT